MPGLRNGAYMVDGRPWMAYNPPWGGTDTTECWAKTRIGPTEVRVISLNLDSGNLYFDGVRVEATYDPALQELLQSGLKAIRQAAAAYVQQRRAVIEQVKKDIS